MKVKVLTQRQFAALKRGKTVQFVYGADVDGYRFYVAIRVPKPSESGEGK